MCPRCTHQVPGRELSREYLRPPARPAARLQGPAVRPGHVQQLAGVAGPVEHVPAQLRHVGDPHAVGQPLRDGHEPEAGVCVGGERSSARAAQ
ncbi:hypothetical protein BsWGS_22149 [Bradybaena similaris]